MEAISIAALTPGKYLIQEYESVATKYGVKFKITLSKSESESVVIWSNKYLYNYLIINKPKDEVEILVEEVEDKMYPIKITIPNYNNKIVLKKRGIK